MNTKESESRSNRFRWDRAIDLLRESSKSSVAVPGSTRTREGKADDVGPFLDLASSLIEDVAFRQTLVGELASTADVMIADIIGGAMGGDELRKRLGIQKNDEARVSDVRETVNLIAEKVVDRLPKTLEAVNLAVQAAAGAVLGAVGPAEPSGEKAGATTGAARPSRAETETAKKDAPTLPVVAEEFLDQLRERAAVRTLKALANWIGEDEGAAPIRGTRRRAPGATGQR